MTTNKNDFLIEIGTEDLPAKGLEKLSKDFENYLLEALAKANVEHGDSKRYVTPRRLAVWIQQLADTQPNAMVERKGPAVTAPAKAQEGFAKSCGVPLDQLAVEDNYLVHRYEQVGKTLPEFMPSLIEEALKKIPVGKTMRWGNHNEAFTRPIRWILMIHGNNVVPGSIFDLPTGNVTYGHRFHSPKSIIIKTPADYEKSLKEHQVIADFDTRLSLIKNIATTSNKDNELFNEIAGLVEWPVILEGHFEKRFSNLPPEVLSTVMAHHQKCFPGKNPNTFVIISNIESVHPQTVIEGNERVMRARLSDAEFFYTADCKRTLESRLEDLKTITFQAKLGSLYDKSVRVSKLAHFIDNNPDSERAGLLCKTDLASGMVGEFPELQGIMGSYYALHDKEKKDVAEALREHYIASPLSVVGRTVSLADRLDTMVGIFGINQQPTGDKDPFGLRRAALCILNILLSSNDNKSLDTLLKKTVENYGDKLPNKNVVPEVLKFILERMRAGYIAQNINNSIVLAVEARGFTHPVDFDKRVLAVKAFSQLPQASALAAANKRVSNILLKEGQHTIDGKPDPSLFEHAAEHALWTAIIDADKRCDKKEYKNILEELATLQTPVDQFFNDVMVMVDNEALRINRLRLLNYLRNLFLQVADISLLQE